MPDEPPDFSDFRRFPLPTVFESFVVVGLWVAAVACTTWLAAALYVLAVLLTAHLAVTALLLRNAAKAIREYEDYETQRRAGRRPKRG